MKETRNYFEAMNWALISWNGWLRNGDKILGEKGSLYLHEQLDIEIRKLNELDAQKVVDDVLEHKDDISLRMKRLEDLGIKQLMDEVNKMAGRTARLLDDSVNNKMDELQRLIIVKAILLDKAYNECAAYLKPQTPKPAARWWKDGKLEEAQEIFRGQCGTAVVRAILRMVYDPDLPLPTYTDFKKKFPDVIGKSDFHRVRKEFEPPKKIEKNAIK